MQFLRTNTATRITVGPFLDKTDGVTPETGLTVTSCKLTMTVDDGGVPTLVLDTAPTASGGANDMVHITGDDAGYYDLELAAANVNYLGRAKLAITDAATHCPVFMEFMIIPAMIYDSIILGTDRLDTNVTHIADTSQTARDIGASVLLSSGTGTGQVKLSSGYVAPNWGDVGNPTTTVGLSGTTVKTATDVETDTADIQSRLPAALTGGGNIKADVLALSGDTTAADNAESFFDGTGYAGTNNVIPTVTTLTGHTAQTGDSYARLGAPAGASVSADIAAVKAETASILTDTAEIGAAGVGLTEAGGTGDQFTAIPWNAAWDAEVQSEVADALVAYFGADAAAFVDTILDEAVSGSITARKAIRLMLAALVGKASGLGTATAVYRNPADTLDAISASVDASGNRTAVTLDDSA